MKQSTTIALDVAKSVFEIAVSDRPGHVSEHHRLRRGELLAFFAQSPPATVVLEACGSAHFWARQLAALGHRPVLLPPQHVRPYRRRNKTDRTDAKALLEAYRDAELRPVPVKSVAHQALASLHRLRSGWLHTRTARLNALRGILRELGETIPQGARLVVPRTLALLEDPDSAVPMALRPALAEACAEIRDLERHIADAQRQLERLGRDIPTVQHLLSVPGIGPLTSTALAALVVDVHRFPSPRHFASYLGLTPREHSSGSTRRLGHISKAGDVYLRMLLIHGARAVLWAAKKKPQPDRLAAWALKLERLRGHNVAAVALANKLARIAWCVWREDRDYQFRSLPQAA